MLSPEQITRYHLAGFTVVPGVLSASDVTGLNTMRALMRTLSTTLLVLALIACATTEEHAGEAAGDWAARIKNQM